MERLLKELTAKKKHELAMDFNGGVWEVEFNDGKTAISEKGTNLKKCLTRIHSRWFKYEPA